MTRFSRENFFQCRSNFLLSPCGSYVFSFLIQNDYFTFLRFTSPLTSFNAYDFIIFHIMIIVTKMICHWIFCFFSPNFRNILQHSLEKCVPCLTNVNIFITFCTKDAKYYITLVVLQLISPWML
jgi:hypothetical protein